MSKCADHVALRRVEIAGAGITSENDPDRARPQLGAMGRPALIPIVGALIRA